MKKRGLSIWSDRTDLKLGESCTQQIKDAISKSRFILIIISSRFLSSDPLISKECTSILERFWKKPEIPVFPVRIDNTDSPAFLKGLSSIRCGREKADVDNLANKILVILHGELPLQSASNVDLEDDESSREEVSLRFSEIKKAIKFLTEKIQEPTE